MDCSVNEIINIMEKIAPSRFVLDWDNAGLLLGNSNQSVHKILVCLDITESTIKEALHLGCNLIISHHPLIFYPLKQIQEDHNVGKLIYMLIKHNIAIFAAHTNLDIAAGGTNDILAELLELKDIHPLSAKSPYIDYENRTGMGRIGVVPDKITLHKLCDKLSCLCNSKMIRTIGDKQNRIQKIAICTGSGSEVIPWSVNASADVLVTGEIKYHDALEVISRNFTVVEIGHFSSEWIVIPFLIKRLQKEVNTLQYKVDIIESKTGIDPYEYTWE